MLTSIIRISALVLLVNSIYACRHSNAKNRAEAQSSKNLYPLPEYDPPSVINDTYQPNLISVSYAILDPDKPLLTLQLSEYNYTSFPMIPEYLDEDSRLGIKYRNDDELMKIEAKFSPDGKIKVNHATLEEGKYIFIMTDQGQIFLLPERGNFHSAMSKGQNLAAAGELVVDPNQKILKITDKSGHYRIGPMSNHQVAQELYNRGVRHNFIMESYLELPENFTKVDSDIFPNDEIDKILNSLEKKRTNFKSSRDRWISHRQDGIVYEFKNGFKTVVSNTGRTYIISDENEFKLINSHDSIHFYDKINTGRIVTKKRSYILADGGKIKVAPPQKIPSSYFPTRQSLSCQGKKILRFLCGIF